jgi:hypothetical protein
MKYILDNFSKFEKYFDDNLSLNLGITLEDIYEYPDIKWNYDFIICRSDLTISFIKAIRDKITIDHIAKLFKNESFDFNEIKLLHNMYFKLPTFGFSFNPNLTYEIVRDNPNIKWNWEFISENKFDKDPNYVKAKQIKQQRNEKYNTIISLCEIHLIKSLSQIVAEYTMFI